MRGVQTSIEPCTEAEPLHFRHPFRLPFTKPSHLWSGPELDVDLAYSDPR